MNYYHRHRYCHSVLQQLCAGERDDRANCSFFPFTKWNQLLDIYSSGSSCSSSLSSHFLLAAIWDCTWELISDTDKLNVTPWQTFEPFEWRPTFLGVCERDNASEHKSRTCILLCATSKCCTKWARTSAFDSVPIRLFLAKFVTDTVIIRIVSVCVWSN